MTPQPGVLNPPAAACAYPRPSSLAATDLSPRPVMHRAMRLRCLLRPPPWREPAANPAATSSGGGGALVRRLGAPPRPCGENRRLCRFYSSKEGVGSAEAAAAAAEAAAAASRSTRCSGRGTSRSGSAVSGSASAVSGGSRRSSPGGIASATSSLAASCRGTRPASRGTASRTTSSKNDQHRACTPPVCCFVYDEAHSRIVSFRLPAKMRGSC